MRSNYDRCLTVCLAFLVAVAAGCGPTTGNGGSDCEPPTPLENADVNGGATLEAGCYKTENGLTVDEGTLTLEPGVTIEFAQGVGLSVTGNGALSAAGTQANPVRLVGTSDERGYWKGLYFVDSNSADNELTGVELQSAGSGQWTGGEESRGGIYLQGDGNRLAITQSTFRQNAQAAIVADDPGANLTIEETSFENNEMPLWLPNNLLGNLASLSFDGNDNGYVRTGIAAAPVTDEQTWPAFEVPYRVRNGIDLGTTLTLDPGVTIEFREGVGVDVSGDGRLTAEGSADEPITLTGVEEERGFWAGLYFQGTVSDDNVLNHVVVEYAGGSRWTGGSRSKAGVFVSDQDVTLAIENTTFRENAHAGLLATSGTADLSVASSSFEANERSVWVAANHVGDLSADLEFSDNDDSHVLVGFDEPSTNILEDQTWPTLQVPYRIHHDIEVGSDAHLTISPGTTLAFEQGEGLQVYGGTLEADASGGDRIQFIAADGETVSGYWQGISFVESLSDANVITNADIMYGGSGRWHGGADSVANIFLQGGGGANSKLRLEDANLAGSGKYGIRVEDGSSVEPCSNVTFEDNSDDATSGTGTIACN